MNQQTPFADFLARLEARTAVRVPADVLPVVRNMHARGECMDDVQETFKWMCPDLVKRPVMFTEGPLVPCPSDATVVALDDDFGINGGRDYRLVEVIHGDPEVLRANAALFAQAPRMFWALQSALKLLDSVAYVAQEGDSDAVVAELQSVLADALNTDF